VALMRAGGFSGIMAGIGHLKREQNGLLNILANARQTSGGVAMLKGISPLLPPELLKTLAEMGHGDEIVIGDGNFPAAAMGKRCIRCDGHGANAMLDAVLALLPLDDFVDAPVTLMQVVPGTVPEGEPPIWADFRDTLQKHEPAAGIGFAERFAFYERSRNAFATVQTGEGALYACVILKKGVVRQR
jgi:L-fucose mutarotase